MTGSVTATGSLTSDEAARQPPHRVCEAHTFSDCVAVAFYSPLPPASSRPSPPFCAPCTGAARRSRNVNPSAPNSARSPVSRAPFLASSSYQGSAASPTVCGSRHPTACRRPTAIPGQGPMPAHRIGEGVSSILLLGRDRLGGSPPGRRLLRGDCGPTFRGRPPRTGRCRACPYGQIHHGGAVRDVHLTAICRSGGEVRL